MPKSCLHVKKIMSFRHHANIVQRVKTCYKIKIDYRVLVCCFNGVLPCKPRSCLTIKPLLQPDSATIRAQKRLCCMRKVAVLECKRGSIAEKSRALRILFYNVSTRKQHNSLCINELSTNAQNSRISPQRFCCAPRS